MSKQIMECFTEILECYVNGQIEDVDDLRDILSAWEFIDEDGELTRSGTKLFTEAEDDYED